MTTETKAVRVHSWDDLNSPGCFMFDEQKRSMLLVCPCGECLRIRSIPLDAYPNDKVPRWHWDGNEDLPTLTPSILDKGGCGWHGFLTAGVFRSC
jgi:hypothetical protein